LLLRSPTLLALRSERVGFAAWVAATAGFAFAVGMISKSVGEGLSPSLRERLSQVGHVEVATPSGYLGLTFLFFTLTAALFCCGRLAAVRAEEAEGRLETLLALPRRRRDVHLGEYELAGVRLHLALEHRAERPARAAPRGPEVDHHRQLL
jgi:putative exporter of polyketide antibiotics